MNHTPPTWTAAGIYIDAPDGALIATVHTEDPATAEADARLIAAAPELLQALSDLLNATPRTHDNRHEHRAAEDAIIKALGD